MIEAVKDAAERESATDELELPRWAVISFERCEGAGLTYADAARLLAELDARGVSGLCVVTKESAERLSA